MTQEDKELLLKDLCARLPYGVKFKFVDNPNIFDLEYRIKFAAMYGDSDKLEDILDITNIKPYLFPLSSMTWKQEYQYREVIASSLNHYEVYDWLNKNHFDYRGLIERGLALDATGKGVY